MIVLSVLQSREKGSCCHSRVFQCTCVGMAQGYEDQPESYGLEVSNKKGEMVLEFFCSHERDNEECSL